MLSLLYSMIVKPEENVTRVTIAVVGGYFDCCLAEFKCIYQFQLDLGEIHE